ncbi:MAG: valine--tRNA ligase [Elusimicrobiota bacterium]
MSEEIQKNYEHGEVEERISRHWMKTKAFRSCPEGQSRRYTIMMPLPNVTGALHMGHAMDNVMQDLLIRWHRMLGHDSLWQPGTDHAGIATQAVVEKRLFELEHKTRHDIGREALVRKIWDWKDEYESRIVAQQQRMGCSCDWDRHRFTLDAVCASAVREAFFRLFKDGLIYRGVRLVNWDCLLQTAVSDDEIVYENVQGHFWHLRYPVVDPKPGEPTHVVVATTRPETMLGDTAVACHPDPRGALEGNEERKALLPLLEKLRDMAKDGRKVMLPLMERPIPLILDEWAKPELGSGCVKITPGHDPNDYGVYERHKDRIGVINILNQDGTLNENAGPYKGLPVMQARKAVLKDLEARGLIELVEDREIPIGHSDRSKTPIEPYLSKQWFVHMGDVEGGVAMGRGTDKEFHTAGLAQAAMDAVGGTWCSASGLRLTFHPDHERYAGIYLSWLKEKRDWCISRQLWWGHRIPIWSASLEAGRMSRFTEAVKSLPESTYHYRVVEDEVQLCLRNEGAEKSAESLLNEFGLERSPDVLDTWFSSALWPFSTLGWPDPAGAKVREGQTPLHDALDRYYPGSCLVTGRDIITLWVARMVMMGLYCLGDMPFHDSFIHANILDGKGERMSKSKGNGIDPVDIIEQYGTDALRYVLCEMQTGTQDIRLPVQAVSPFTGKLVDLAHAKHGRSIFTYLCPETGNEFDVLGTLQDVPRAKLISDRFEVGRAFCTKLWNASRFAFMNLGDYAYAPVSPDALREEDRWILSRLAATVRTVTESLKGYNPSAAIGAAREFFWSDLCDWYIELVRPRFKDSREAPAAKTVLSFALDQTLRMLHPAVPFITEELWEKLNAQAPVRGLEVPLPKSELLIKASWPQKLERFEDRSIEAEFGRLQEVVRVIRDVRAKYQVSPKTQLKAVLRSRGESLAALTKLQRHILSQAGLSAVLIGDAPVPPRLSATAVAGETEVFVEGVLDPEKERKRLDKQLAQVRSNIQLSERKLSDPRFTEKAPTAIVETERRRLTDSKSQLAALEEQLKQLA